MIKAGAAHRTINNEIGTSIQAAGHDEKVKYIRDDLEANGLWLETSEDGLLFISCDIGGLELPHAQDLLGVMSRASGIAKEKIILGSTHTHSGPSLFGPSHPDKSIDTAYLKRLENWLCELAVEARDSAEQVQLAWGAGEAEIGYNRRVCHADGSHVMHGAADRPDFTGLEGTRDPQHTAVFLRDMNGGIKAILHNNTAHPVTFYGANFLSADFPGLARAYLRDVFGDISVLFFNGTIGDISPADEVYKALSPESREQRLARPAHLMTGETLRLLQHADFKDDVALGHEMVKFDVGLRDLPEARLKWAQDVMTKYRKDKDMSGGLREVPTAHMTLLLHERYGDKGVETIDLHAGYIDELAFVTAPCEMFTHFGLQVKRRSPFPATAFLGLVNGDMGYCGTLEAVLGGSWEGTVAYSVRWEIEAGYKIVDDLCRMLYRLRSA